MPKFGGVTTGFMHQKYGYVQKHGTSDKIGFLQWFRKTYDTSQINIAKCQYVSPIFRHIQVILLVTVQYISPMI